MAKISPNELCPCASGETFDDCHGEQIRNRTLTVTQHIPLRIIGEPDPGTRAVFEKMGEGTIVFTGLASTISLDCGRCSAPLAVGVELTQLQGLVIKCLACGQFNDTATAPMSTTE